MLIRKNSLNTKDINPKCRLIFKDKISKRSLKSEAHLIPNARNKDIKSLDIFEQILAIISKLIFCIFE
jgi:hypothetical protein